MATTVQPRAPVHLWIVGILSLLWGCMGAYDYVMTRMHNMAYLASSMPGIDPNVGLAWIEAMPMYAQIGWGLGVWGGLLGALLLLIRSRFAVWAYAASMLGLVVSMGFAHPHPPPPPPANGMMFKIFPWIIIVIGVFMLWYSWSMEKKGVLR
jgi:hypothetical protein